MSQTTKHLMENDKLSQKNAGMKTKKWLAELNKQLPKYWKWV